MKQFNTYSGQTYSDVTLNTYGSLDYYVKLLNDNNLSPEDVPQSGGVVLWDTNNVVNQSVQTLLIENNVIFATMPTPEEINALMPARMLQENTNFLLQEDGKYILL